MKFTENLAKVTAICKTARCSLAQIRFRIAGINHMAWLLELTENGKDLYPEIKRIARRKVKSWRKAVKDAKPGNMLPKFR